MKSRDTIMEALNGTYVVCRNLQQTKSFMHKD